MKAEHRVSTTRFVEGQELWDAHAHKGSKCRILKLCANLLDNFLRLGHLALEVQ